MDGMDARVPAVRRHATQGQPGGPVALLALRVGK